MESWKKIREELIFNAPFVKVMRRFFIDPTGKEKSYDIYLENNSASVLAITKDNKVIVAEQFRPGPEKVFWELPGGMVEEGEKPEDAIRRELLEETGCKGEIKFIGTAYQDGYSTRKRFHFVATSCEKVQEIKNMEGEFTEFKLIDLEEFKKYIKTGELTDLQTVLAGLEFLDLL